MLSYLLRKQCQPLCIGHIDLHPTLVRLYCITINASFLQLKKSCSESQQVLPRMNMCSRIGIRTAGIRSRISIDVEIKVVNYH